EPRCRASNLRRTVRLLVGGSADFLSELVDFGDDVGNLPQRRVEVLAKAQAFVYDAGALIHILDCLAGFFLNALDQFGDFLGGLRRFLGKFANFVGNYGKPQTVFARSRRFNGSVESEKVRLLGKIVNHFNNLSDVVGTLTQRSDDLA